MPRRRRMPAKAKRAWRLVCWQRGYSRSPHSASADQAPMDDVSREGALPWGKGIVTVRAGPPGASPPLGEDPCAGGGSTRREGRPSGRRSRRNRAQVTHAVGQPTSKSKVAFDSQVLFYRRVRKKSGQVFSGGVFQVRVSVFFRKQVSISWLFVQQHFLLPAKFLFGLIGSLKFGLWTKGLDQV